MLPALLMHRNVTSEYYDLDVLSLRLQLGVFALFGGVVRVRLCRETDVEVHALAVVLELDVGLHTVREAVIVGCRDESVLEIP